jgi:hypothetical protein
MVQIVYPSENISSLHSITRYEITRHECKTCRGWFISQRTDFGDVPY